MDNTYNSYFFNEFYAESGGGNYLKKDNWMPFFSNIADQIIKIFKPRTVLDAGCATGYLVEVLRDKGVEAYGFDISEYAISNVRENIKPFCIVHSITDPLPDSFPRNFDLVITIEVLEHLYPEEGKKAITNLCNYTDTILFTSTPDDINDKTHVNVQQKEYWASAFAENSFFRDLIQPVDFIAPWAMLFLKKDDIPKVIHNYEMNIRILESELDKQEKQHAEALVQIEDLRCQLADTSAAFKSISRYICRRITKPLRPLLDFVKMLLKSNRITNTFYRGLKCLKENGLKYTLHKTKYKLSAKERMKEHFKRHSLSDKEKVAQRNTVFSKEIKFSILVPLYNTPKKYLKEMIDSVIAQTYSNWELCMADGSDENHGDVREICEKYASEDKRILYRKLEVNLGISENTNKCIEMATGDYLALLDHDDLLHPSALYENMKVICEKDADFIYTDEDSFHNEVLDAFCPHFKPDFSPDTLRSYNYICHFSVFSRELLDKVGWFRSEFDGSQDYDIILKLTEQARKVAHIPKILYYWRAHKDSVAADLSAKPYAINAAKKALSKHLNRVGLTGEVMDSKISSTYKINYEIQGKPLISILIPNADHVEDLKECIQSIVESSTYANYEIIIIENNSTKRETFEYYQSLKNNDRIKIVIWEGEFNYSAINNFGFRLSTGEYILLLNNDIKIITPNWIEEMLMFAQREDVGAVGVKLYYPDHTIQHAGVILGIGGIAGHSHKNNNRNDFGYMSRLTIAQNLSAVTAACMMVPRKVFERVGGLDEYFKVAFNDVDLCMKIRQAGYLIVFTPYAEAYHYESKSRGSEDTHERKKRFQDEVLRFKERWGKELQQGDSYYNPNLTLSKEDFSIKRFGES